MGRPANRRRGRRHLASPARRHETQHQTSASNSTSLSTTSTTATTARGPQMAGETQAEAATAARQGLITERVWTTEGGHPYDEVTWERRDVVMTNWRDGSINFEQRGVEFPDFWSVNAANIVTPKYFHGGGGLRGAGGGAGPASGGGRRGAPAPPRAGARPAERPRWSSSTSTTPTWRSSSRRRPARKTRSGRCGTPGSTWTSAARTSSA